MVKITFIVMLILIPNFAHSKPNAVCEQNKLGPQDPNLLALLLPFPFYSGYLLYKKYEKQKYDLVSDHIANIHYEKDYIAVTESSTSVFCPEIGIETVYEKKFKFIRSKTYSLTNNSGMSIDTFDVISFERKHDEYFSSYFSMEDELTVVKKITGDGVSCYRLSYVALYKSGKVEFSCKYGKDELNYNEVLNFKYKDGYEIRVDKCRKDLYLISSVCKS